MNKRVVIQYRKSMLNYDPIKEYWDEITNLGILERLAQIKKSILEAKESMEELKDVKLKFDYFLKPDPKDSYDHTGKIIIKSSFCKYDLIRLVGKGLGDVLDLTWR